MELIRFMTYFIFGLIFGSFGNVLIYRLPKGISIINPPSSCPKCGKRIKWYDNIPVISYLILRGKCRYCGNQISIRYPLVELLNGILFMLAGIYFKNDVQATICSLFFFLLIVISFIDIEHMIIPDKISLTFALASLGISVFGSIVEKPFLPLIGKPGLIFSIEGVVYLMVAFIVIEALSRKIFNKEGIGMGDIKLGISIGIYLGPYSLLSLFLAYFIGAPLGFYLKYKVKSEYIPFGPFLALGSIITIFFGEAIVRWYFSLAGIKF